MTRDATLNEKPKDETNGPPDKSVPLCVDLDGTLFAGDLFIEGLFAALRQPPRLILRALMRSWRSRAAAKNVIAQQVKKDVSTLPYRAEVVEWLREQEQQGRQLVLVTAAARDDANAVSDHLGLFEDVIASDGRTNVKGRTKSKILAERFGENQFDYVGDSFADIAVWRTARRAILVEPSKRLERHVGKIAHVDRVFPRRAGFATWLQLIRPHQWAKNLLLFLPLVGAHRLGDVSALIPTALAFVWFSLCASGIYVLNDLFDLDDDRRHTSKKHRPLAAGMIPTQQGALAGVALVAVSVLLSLSVSISFFAWLCTYVVLSTTYSIWFKRMLMVDVTVLTGLYTLRVIAGGAATDVVVSFWLLAFSVFFFLGLALLKRYIELVARTAKEADYINGRDYRRTDASILQSLGVAAGYTAVVIFALYINSDGVRDVYARPEALWMLCPLLIYWLGRVWLLASRGLVSQDPVVYALTDRQSNVLVVLGLVILLGIA